MRKFSDKLSKLTTVTLLDKAKNLKRRDEKEQQLTSYSFMLKFAQRVKKDLDKIALIGLAHMAYGWMPTMIRHIRSDFNLAVWKKKIEKGSLEKDFLEEVMALTNDSIVGTSKLLHFLNPEMYPIYDSKVYTSITNGDKHNLSKDIDNFVKYSERLRDFAKYNKSDIAIIRKILVEKDYIPQDSSDIRVLEACLYASAK